MNRILKLPFLVLALILSDCQNKPLPVNNPIPVQPGSADVTKTSNEACDPQFPLPPKCLEKEEKPEMDAVPIYTDNRSMELQITPFPHELPAETEGELTLTFTATEYTEGRDIEISLNAEAVSEVTTGSLNCGFLEQVPECDIARNSCRIYLEYMDGHDECVFTFMVTASDDFDLEVKSCSDLETTSSPVCLKFIKKTDNKLPNILVTP